MASRMKKLISKGYYKTKEEALEKCDVFFAMNRITANEYKELLSLITEIYGTK